MILRGRLGLPPMEQYYKGWGQALTASLAARAWGQDLGSPQKVHLPPQLKSTWRAGASSPWCLEPRAAAWHMRRSHCDLMSKTNPPTSSPSTKMTGSDHSALGDAFISRNVCRVSTWNQALSWAPGIRMNRTSELATLCGR